MLFGQPVPKWRVFLLLSFGNDQRRLVWAVFTDHPCHLSKALLMKWLSFGKELVHAESVPTSHVTKLDLRPEAFAECLALPTQWWIKSHPTIKINMQRVFPLRKQVVLGLLCVLIQVNKGCYSFSVQCCQSTGTPSSEWKLNNPWGETNMYVAWACKLTRMEK